MNVNTETKIQKWRYRERKKF